MGYKNIKSLKAKYGETCKSKCENQDVLFLYSYILEKERVDSDWWSEGHGCDDVIGILERTFNDSNWNLLEDDIENWTDDQIELFTLSILVGNSGNGINEDEKLRDEQIEYTLNKRANILLKISNIHSSIIIWNNIIFFEKISYLSSKYITQIAKNIGYYDNLNSDWKNSEEMNLMKKLIKNSFK